MASQPKSDGLQPKSDGLQPAALFPGSNLANLRSVTGARNFAFLEGDVLLRPQCQGHMFFPNQLCESLFEPATPALRRGELP